MDFFFLEKNKLSQKHWWHEFHSQVWQSCAVSPQQPLSHTGEQLEPGTGETRCQQIRGAKHLPHNYQMNKRNTRIRVCIHSGCFRSPSHSILELWQYWPADSLWTIIMSAQDILSIHSLPNMPGWSSVVWIFDVHNIHLFLYLYTVKFWSKSFFFSFSCVYVWNVSVWTSWWGIECFKVNQLLTVGGAGLQSMLTGVDVLPVQGVSPNDALGVWEAQLGVAPNIHPTHQDLCRGHKHKMISSTLYISFQLLLYK